MTKIKREALFGNNHIALPLMCSYSVCITTYGLTLQCDVNEVSGAYAFQHLSCFSGSDDVVNMRCSPLKSSFV